MKGEKTYTFRKNKWCMFIVYIRLGIVFLLLFLTTYPSSCLGQEESKYDEFKIYLNVQGIGGARISAIIKDEKAYLSISDVFTLLKIKNTPSVRFDSLSGFFINQQDEYLVDRVKNQILFQGKNNELRPDDLILTESNLFMKSSLFGDLFGLNCEFNYREFSVILTTKLELPLIREMKLEQMRANLRLLKGEVKSDTSIGRSYPFFKFGMADWSVATQKQEGMNTNTQLNLALGSVVAGGEMNVGLYYDQNVGFNSRQQSYLWRYVNNDHVALRQVLVGKIIPQSISLLNGSLIGIQLTNAPSIYRRSFGTYTLSNVTEPGWLVELYINNVLVDFVKADASGFYKFEVPLVYGNSVMMVRMYGPWGEVRTRTETTTIPFNFLPPGELEYTINAGTVDERPNTKYSRTNINYGVSRQISIGGGYEYFSSPLIVNSLPFLSSSVMLFNDFLIAGEYTFGVRLKSSLSFRLPYNFQFNLNYTGYEKGQKAVLFAPLQERGASVSLPFHGRHFSIYSRISLNQKIYSDIKTTDASVLLSGNFYGVSTNVTTTLTYHDPKHVYAFSDISLLFRLPHRFILMPAAQYDHNQQKLTLLRCNLEKPIFRKGYLNISYEHRFIGQIRSIAVGFRYDFSFMQAGLVARLSKNGNAFSQSASGSLLFDRKSNYIGASNTSKVGRGGFIIMAFLDLNCNGKRDINEPKVIGLNIQINGGCIERSDRDSTIRVTDLTAYTSYLVAVDKNSIQSLSWQFKKLTLSVTADPNQFKLVEIPIQVVGEASGTVNVKSKNMARGLGGIYVYFYNDNQKLIGRTLTEVDGYYSYMGLQPGEYVARLDSSQLTKNQMTDANELKRFTVKSSNEGDVVDGLNFSLQSMVKDTTASVMIKEVSDTVSLSDNASTNLNNILNGENQIGGISGIKKPNRKNDSIPFGVSYSQGALSRIKQILKNDSIPFGVRYSQDALSKIKQFQRKDSVLSGVRYSKGNPTTNKPNLSNITILKPVPQIAEVKGLHYAIQVGAYTIEGNAVSVQQKMKYITGLPVNVVSVDGLYKIWIEGFTGSRQAERFVKRLSKMGYQSYVMMVYR